jgi:AraC-like DNA-binding protein
VWHLHIHFDVLGVPRRTANELFVRPLEVPDCDSLKDKVRALWGVQDTGRDLPDAERLVTELRLTALLYETMAQVIAMAVPEAKSGSLHLDAPQETVQPALEFIAAHLDKRLTIAQLASLCCLSEDYFIRRFRQCMGVTPTQYIQEQRVNAAAQRLVFSDDTIERIIRETGFGSRYYFTRIFKRYTGRSPGSYRKTPPV